MTAVRRCGFGVSAGLVALALTLAAPAAAAAVRPGALAGAVLAVLGFGVLHGMLLAIGLSVLGLVLREFPVWLQPFLEAIPRDALRLLS